LPESPVSSAGNTAVYRSRSVATSSSRPNNYRKTNAGNMHIVRDKQQETVAYCQVHHKRISLKLFITGESVLVRTRRHMTSSGTFEKLIRFSSKLRYHPVKLVIFRAIDSLSQKINTLHYFSHCRKRQSKKNEDTLKLECAHFCRKYAACVY